MSDPTEQLIAKADEEISKATREKTAYLSLKAEQTGASDLHLLEGKLLLASDPKMGILVDAERDALRKRWMLPVEGICKALDDEREKLMKEQTDDVEKFAVANNLDQGAALIRLLEISTIAKQRAVRISKIGAEKTQTIETSKAAIRKQAEAQRGAIASAEATRKAREGMRPAEAALQDRIEVVAAERGVDIGKATSWALENDPAAIALRKVDDAERRGVKRSV